MKDKKEIIKEVVNKFLKEDFNSKRIYSETPIMKSELKKLGFDPKYFQQGGPKYGYSSLGKMFSHKEERNDNPGGGIGNLKFKDGIYSVDYDIDYDGWRLSKKNGERYKMLDFDPKISNLDDMIAYLKAKKEKE